LKESQETAVSDLASQRCVPCKGGVPPLRGRALDDLLARLGGGWQVVDEHHLAKEYRFRDFADALTFTNRVGALAEAERHHPDIHLAWGRVRLEIWTHVIDGLTESDFVLAAKADRLEGAEG
jgi:4a-hydroxytetrahydrobiopterin dehydratase